MKKLLLAVLATFAGWCYAAPPSPYAFEVNSQGGDVPALESFQALQRVFTVTYKRGTNAEDLTSSKPFMFWARSDQAANFVTAQWAIVTATSGIAQFTFTAQSMNSNGNFRYGVGIKDTQDVSFVVKHGKFRISPTPWATGVAAVVFSSNQNLAGWTFVNDPWAESSGDLTQFTGLPTTSGRVFKTIGTGSGQWQDDLNTGSGSSGNAASIYGMAISATVTGASASDVLMWDGANWLAASLVNYATVTNLRGLGVAFTNQLIADGVIHTNQQGQITTNLANAGVNLTNSILAQGVINTNAQGQITTNLVLAGATATNVTGLGVVVTNNFLAQGLIQTNLIANGLADTNNLIADGLTQTNLGRAGLIHTNFVGLTATNLNALGLAVTNNLTSQGLIGTNLTANGLQITNNLIAQGLINTQLIANGLADTNLSGRVTTNLTEQGLIATNLVAVGLQVTNNLTAQGLIATNLTANGLYATNTQGQVTTNLTRLGLAETNHIGLGVVVTNIQGQVTTNLAWFTTLNDSAVSKTSTPGQVMSSDLRSLGTLHANTNLVAADTNSVGGELLTGGAFTGSAAGFALTNAGYNANNVLVLPSAVATITYTQNTPIVGGKAYLVSWDNTLAYGTNFTTFTLSLGGVTNAMGNSPTGTTARLFQAFTAQNPVWTVAPGTNQWVGDNLSVKQVTAGNLLIAKDGTIGGRLAVGESIATTGSVTAGSFSGTSTSFVEIAGDTMTGALMISNNLVSGNGHTVLGGGLGIALVGGVSNSSGDDFSFVGGGELNNAEANNVGIMGGYLNNINGDFGAIVAGKYNSVGGENSVTIGGRSNIANGADAFAAGVDAVAGYTRSFVWSDGMTNDFGSTASNQFAVHASGGIRLAGGPVYGDGSGLTNLPAAATTAGVDSISVTGAVSGVLIFNEGPGVDLTQTNKVFNWAVDGSELTAINGAGVTGAVPLSAQGVGTGSVGVAVNLGITNAAAGTINGTYPNINIGTNDSQGSATGTLFSINSSVGPNVTVEGGANITVTTTGTHINVAGAAAGGGTGTLYDINGIVGPSATIAAGANVAVTVTGAVINIASTASGGGGGGAYAFQGTNNIAPTNGLNPVAVNAHETVIGGGVSNAIIDGVFLCVIGGGASNVIQASSAFPLGSLIAGGLENVIIDAIAGTISGGKKNKINSTGVGNNITGGGWNEIITSGGGYNSILGGGNLNFPSKILGSGDYNVLINGYNNHITNASNWSLIGNGDDNNIGAANFATILNGESDTILDADYATIINGQSHTIGSAATYSTILNGKQNAIAASAAYALAGGRRAKANHPGVFIWADSTDADFASTADKQFLIRAAGGLWLNDDATLTVVSGTRFVTNVDPKVYVPARQGALLYDVGSNLTYLAETADTNGWVKSAVWTAAP